MDSYLLRLFQLTDFQLIDIHVLALTGIPSLIIQNIFLCKQVVFCLQKIAFLFLSLYSIHTQLQITKFV